MAKNIQAKVIRNKNRKVRWDRLFLLAIVVGIIFFFATRDKVKEDKIVFIRETSDSAMTEEIDDYVWGIDISHWQVNSIDQDWFEEAKSKGCKFVYIQFGKTNVDDSDFQKPILDYSVEALAFAEMAENVGIDFGFYFLTDAKVEATRLSELGSIMCFINSVKAKKFTKNSLPIMLDHEVYGNVESLEDSEARVEMLVRQISDLNEFSINPIVYTSGSKLAQLREKLGPDQLFWVADYSKVETGEAPTEFPEEYDSTDIAIWQYAGDNYLIEERGIPVIDKSVTEGPIVQAGLDRNLMRTDTFIQLIA